MISNAMTALELFEQLQQLKVKLRLDKGELRFSAPKGVVAGELLERLKAEKEALIALLTELERGEQLLQQPLALADRTQGLPLSYAQRRFWFLDQLDGGNSATYNMLPMALQLEGAFNLAAMEQALNRLIERHQVLATRFSVVDGAPRQFDAQAGRLVLQKFDLSDSGEQQSAVTELIRQQGEMAFDLTAGEALIRAAVVQLAPQRAVFILTLHHIIADGWSLDILVQELAQLYLAACRGVSADLPPLAIQYGDFAAWEQQRLQGAVLQQQLAYWREQLADAPTRLELPTDSPRPRQQSYRGATLPFQLSGDLSDQFNALCQQQGVTPFMALLALFGVLLCRYSDQEDMVIGSPVSVRPHPQSEPLIGLFLNTLPFRIDLSANPSFSQLLARVKPMAIAAYAHSEVPFDELLQALNIRHSLNHTPLFQVLFALQNAPMQPVELEGLRLTPLESENSRAPFDLVLSMEQLPQGLYGRFRYSTDLFRSATIEQLARHFQRLLQQVVADPDQAIRHLPLVDAAELAQQWQWRGQGRHFTVTQSLCGWFEQQVAQSPNAVALSDENGSLSYVELNRRANQLAHRLVKSGVTAGERVGLALPRCHDLLVGLIAILKAGGAYVPLDPNYPAERLDYIATDAALQRVVTDSGLLPLAGASIRRIEVSDLTLATEPDSNLDKIEPNQVAYVIYTSGSTGKPKGVEVSHANVVRLFLSSESIYHFGADDVWTLFHSYAFDFSVWEIWGALLYGGRLVVVPYGVSRSPDAFLELLIEQQVTVLNQTPSAFKQLMEIDRLRGGPANQLKWVIFGGEALELQSLQGWVKRHGLQQPQLVNMYGITETTVHVTWHTITAADLAQNGSVIGEPLADLSLYLRDRYGQPVPLGVAGEMLVGGDGVAKGYLNRPKLTAERFIAAETVNIDPQAGRLYRSGDLARRRHDGRLEYWGRMDEQVKIRGFRIELGEIESAIAAQPGVSAVVVGVHQSDSGAELVAWVSGLADEADFIQPLRQRLQQQLPDYMVPARWVVLAQMPLTANGKIDRRALPEPQMSIDSGDYVAPDSPLAELIAALWQEILHIERVGMADNFFELGGDSIKGAIFANRMQQQTGSVFYVVALFEAPTIAELLPYMAQHYPEIVTRFNGDSGVAQQHDLRLGQAEWQQLREAITPLAPLPQLANRPKNRRAIFVLAPPRSGTTLLRVLLGGHSQLFAPPELELMPFNTLGERAEVCSGRDAFWLEGNLRAVMELKGLDADGAKALMAELEQADMSVHDYYGLMQQWLGERILVDKSPSYVLHRSILERMEQSFDQPLYIHLHRHPYGMMNSFEEAKLHQIFFRYPHNFTPRQLAELIWLQSHDNINRFLATIPPQRQCHISFEAMTAEPKQQMERLCHELGLAFEPTMLQLYEAKQRQRRMTDGIHAESTMLGDVKFHSHSKIDAAASERWRERYQEDFLGEPAWQLAERLGYQREQRAESVAVTTAPPLERVEARQAGEALPLSFAQQRLWFLDQLEGAGEAYHIPLLLQLTGSLNLSALTQAWRWLAERQQSLCAVFDTVAGAPVVRLKALPPPLVIDLCHLAPELREQQQLFWLEQEIERRFKLDQGPLVRVTLIRTAPNSSLLLIVLHHIIADGWSVGVLGRELEQLYRAACRNERPALPPLPIQYSDYARWQRDWMAGGELERQRSYWQQQLAGIPPLLELPTDAPRPAQQSFRGATLSFEIRSELANGLRKLAEQHQASLYMVLLAGYALQLSRYSHQHDIVIGSPSANRSRSEIEGLIGFFMNTLVMRIGIEPQQPFIELLQQVRQRVLAAFNHQELSFEQLVEALQPPRNLSYAPIFQVLFSYQSAPAELPQFEGLEVARVEHTNTIAKYDLTLSLTERSGALAGELEYNCDLFQPWRMAQFWRNYVTLLEAIVATPEGAVGRLPLIEPATRRQLQQWNQTQRPLATVSLVELLTAQAERSAASIALEVAGEQFSYRQLFHLARQFTHLLQQRGVKQGDRVAVALRRNRYLVPTLLAVLQSGAAYIPLDPTYPKERLAMIFDEGRPTLVVTEQALVDTLPLSAGARLLVDSDDTGALLASREAQPLPVTISGEELAYIIFTSGSTGRPKGVMLPHRAVVNFITSMMREPGLYSTDRLLAVTTISFDIAVLELWGTLAAGGTIVLASESEARDGEALLGYLQQRQISLMQATPATWRLLLAVGWQGSRSLRILCGGEAMPKRLAAELLPRCEQLWNMYGPTETTVWSTIKRIGLSQSNEGAGSSEGNEAIGRAIDNTLLYVVDSELEQVPIGVTGELLIGGVGVACGYLNRPELTEERFMASPFITKSGQELSWPPRLYRSGDRVKWTPEGELIYLERIDQQVKIRGFRVELGEIETLLEQHPTVIQAVVVVREDEHRGQQLVAFLRLRQPDSVDSLRQYLLERLPDYMVPTIFLPLETMPLTQNGKVDRNALQLPEGYQSPPKRERILPRDPLELQLVALWQNLLQRQPIGVTDNFFELGGHSLVAVRLMAEIADRFDRHLPLAALFQGATVAELANLLRQTGGESLWPTLITMRQGGAAQVKLFVVPGAGGNVVYFQPLVSALDEQIAVYGLQPPGLDGKTALIESVEGLASHYLNAIRQQQPSGPYYITGHSFGGSVAFEMARQLAEQGERIGTVVLLDTPAPHFVQPTGVQWDQAQWLGQVAAIAEHSYGVELGITVASLRQLDSDESQLALLHRQLMATGVLPQGGELSHLRGFIGVYQANLRCHYVGPTQPLSLPVTLLRSAELQPGELAAEESAAMRAEADFGWGRYVSRAVEVVEVPGDHLTMLNPPQVSQLAAVIANCLSITVEGAITDDESRHLFNR
ncbi:non-ribosomal peptide synthetase [Ectothiorhodospiraceae bacterium BW-2]|nr:non-ribosomal peptide synthetase [Ectothiorhodospiraceae bacterium BW-2]